MIASSFSHIHHEALRASGLVLFPSSLEPNGEAQPLYLLELTKGQEDPILRDILSVGVEHLRAISGLFQRKKDAESIIFDAADFEQANKIALVTTGLLRLREYELGLEKVSDPSWSVTLSRVLFYGDGSEDIADDVKRLNPTKANAFITEAFGMFRVVNEQLLYEQIMQAFRLDEATHPDIVLHALRAPFMWHDTAHARYDDAGSVVQLYRPD